MHSEHLPRFSLHDVVVDVFGSLLPGLIFVACSALTLGWPIAIGIELWKGTTGNAGMLLATQGFVELMRPFKAPLLFVSVVMAYVVGHVLYRRDPNEPDKRSLKKIRKKLRNPQERDAWVVGDEAEWHFPYPNLRGYLTSRGLRHLARMVPWTHESFTGICTKQFINTLKIRLAFYAPDKCGLVSRNEAHVRLMTSTWYMARGLRWVAFASGCLLWVEWAAWIPPRSTWLETLVELALLLLFPGVLFALMLLVSSNIEQFLQYQRVREIVFVLETAYAAFRDTPKYLCDICPECDACHEIGLRSSGTAFIDSSRMVEAGPPPGSGAATAAAM